MSLLFWIGVVILLRSFVFVYRWLISYVARPVNLGATYHTNWAIVTGAGSGLGRHLSRMIAEQGINVIGVDRDEQGLASTKSDIESQGHEFVPVIADLCQHHFASKIMSACGDRDIGVVILNAGLGIVGPVCEREDEFVANYIFLMTTSYAILAREFMVRNASRKDKSLLYMTASLAADCTAPLGALYCGVKAYKSRLLKHLAAETNIAMTAMHPGFFRMSKFFRTVRSSVQSWADSWALMPTSSQVADAVLRTLGRTELVDLTWQSIAARSLLWGLRELPIFYVARLIITVSNWILRKKDK
jgi:short-subunit dehydrogenase